MKNIKFSLRQQGKGEPVIVLNVYDARFPGRRFMYSTGHHCSTGEWSIKKERPKDDHFLTAHLDLLERLTADFLKARLSSRTLAREDLKAWIHSHLKDERAEAAARIHHQQQDAAIYAIWQVIIDTAKTPNGRPAKPATKSQKNQTLRKVKEYAAARQKGLSFKTLDINFYHDFDAWMIENKLKDNTRGKHLKEIKAICREAAERGMDVNPAYLRKSWRVIRAKIDAVYLTIEDIKKLLSADGLTTAQQRLRDIFVMACFVGARHSDWSQIRIENIVIENKREILKYKQTKTGEIVHVPLHPVVKTLLHKYISPPRVITNQKFNEELKIIAAAAQLGTCVLDGQIIEKSTAISTHTARRSFATNAFLSKSMDVHTIMRCTGHKKEASFLAYLKLDGRDHAAIAAESKFFTEDFTLLKIA